MQQARQLFPPAVDQSNCKKPIRRAFYAGRTLWLPSTDYSCEAGMSILAVVAALGFILSIASVAIRAVDQDLRANSTFDQRLRFVGFETKIRSYFFGGLNRLARSNLCSGGMPVIRQAFSGTSPTLPLILDFSSSALQALPDQLESRCRAQTNQQLSTGSFYLCARVMSPDQSIAFLEEHHVFVELSARFWDITLDQPMSCRSFSGSPVGSPRAIRYHYSLYWTGKRTGSPQLNFYRSWNMVELDDNHQ